MSGTDIELRPIHWDILKLVRTVCYEGLPETKCAFVNEHDRWLPLWKPNPPNTRFVLPNGAPEPLVRACLLAVPFDESEQRWGKGGFNTEPALQYLIDRKLLRVSKDNKPICAAFRSHFNDSEMLATIRELTNENGRFHVWDSGASRMGVHEENGLLVTNRPYAVFQLTERAQELLDAEETLTEPGKPVVNEVVNKTSTDPKPEDQLKPSHRRARALYEWALEHINDAENMTYAELFDALTSDPRCGGEGLPNNAATFSRYCRGAGIHRNTPRRGKCATRSVRRVSDL